MRTVYHIIDNMATSKAPILITGESDTGKELSVKIIYKIKQAKLITKIPRFCQGLNCSHYQKNDNIKTMYHFF